MGLKERRAIKEFEEYKYPKLKKQVYDVLGYEPEMTVDWERLAVDGYAERYGEYIPMVFFDPMMRAFQTICKDDMGKEALEEILTKIELKNDKGNYSPLDFAEFKRGVLTLNHMTEANVGNVDDRTRALTKLLEDEL